MFAKNQKGRSQGVFITEFHLGNYKKHQSDLVKQASHPSPIFLGLVFTLLLLGMTIIARLYWKSRKIKKEVVKEDKYNMESRCSLLKQDTFAVSIKPKNKCHKMKFDFFSRFSLIFLDGCLFESKIQAGRHEHQNEREN